MSRIVNVHEAKTHFSKLLEEVSGGSEIVVAKAGHPVAKLVPYVAPEKPRMLGRLAGKIQESPDCWAPDEEFGESLDAPLDPAAPSGAPRVAEENRP